MTSIGSYVKQIPLNNGYFRPIPSLTGDAEVSSFMYSVTTTTGVPVFTGFTPQGISTQAALSLGTCLLKDMGTQILSTQATGNASPIVFRRVQVVDNLSANAGLATDGVSGQYVGADSDYNVAYILMGFNGAAPVGPFVRTG
jgi:hypothetical protein